MILAVALNPALDVTHHVARVEWSALNRPLEVHARPGGKGLNVARTLHSLGARTRVLGFAGGFTGSAVAAGLAELGVPASFTTITGETRRTFAVTDAHRSQVALFSEPGPRVSQDEYAGFRAMYTEALADSAAVVMSGSLPPGLPPGTYAELGALAVAAGVPVVLDTHGEALRLGAAAGPAIVKPNLSELEALAGQPLSAADGADARAVAQAARSLKAAGAQAVVVTLGEAGLWAGTDDGWWRVVPPATAAANPTGAGDAVAAGLAHGIALGQPWEERLLHAAALGTAVAAAPVAGEFSRDDYQRALAGAAIHRGGAAW